MKKMHVPSTDIEEKKRLAKILFDNAVHLEELESEQAKHVHNITYVQMTYGESRKIQETLKRLKKEIAKAEKNQEIYQAEFDAIKTDNEKA